MKNGIPPWACNEGAPRSGFSMSERRTGSAMTAAAICAAAFAVLAPRATDAGAVLVAQDDPVRLADLQLESVLRNDPALIGRNIEAALASQDPDLAGSFVDLAEARGISIPGDLTQRVTEAAEEENSTKGVAKRFFSGLVTGNAVDGASLSGTLAGDLCVFGDVRDIVREGSHLAKGEDTDRLLLGLAVAGVAVTGATFATVGSAAPARVGLTLVKDARKAGRLGEGLSRWAGRSAREMVDMRQLQKAFAAGSLAQPRGRRSPSRPRFAQRKPADWCGSPRMSAASARRLGRAVRSTFCGSLRGRKMWRAPPALQKPKADRPARSSRSWDEGRCCSPPVHSILRCGCSAPRWRCSVSCHRSGPRPSA
ncbi:hypothetical protein Nwi_2180 [Nitrobacter winogradskyi Nb-255]|uniref:Uncharacterized protein n=1 Tax=Nitrobacter winogradskyi (strain ATCC 25391 / DSM 10237 / CIP 104748 / NCIMB 11846 / Nb-255) TaxID=323098 RepID=Q3SQK7_NITWN|nr:hypothetical protein Nwi_2180 [Nitrobacter winogradskyi Nb-255]